MFTLIITTFNEDGGNRPDTRTHSISGFMTKELADKAGEEYIDQFEDHDITAIFITVQMSNQS